MELMQGWSFSLVVFWSLRSRQTLEHADGGTSSGTIVLAGIQILTKTNVYLHSITHRSRSKKDGQNSDTRVSKVKSQLLCKKASLTTVSLGSSGVDGFRGLT